MAIFYHALSFDLAALLQPQIDSIQLALHDSVFTPLLQVALMGAIVLAITKYAKRDFSGLLGQLGKVIFIMVLSLMIVRDSATLLSYATSVTKSVSVSILTGISGTNVESISIIILLRQLGYYGLVLYMNHGSRWNLVNMITQVRM